jgi:hypothetical protein
MDYHQTVDRLVEHIRRQGFFVVESEPSARLRWDHARVAMVVRRGGGNAHRPPMDLPISQDVIRTVENAPGLTCSSGR